jgi:hypothetical protein
MKIRQALIIVVFFLLVAGAVYGLAQQAAPFPPPPHHRGCLPPLPGSVCTDGKYLYVVLGPKIYLYSVPDLNLKKTVELPKPTPPPEKK